MSDVTQSDAADTNAAAHEGGAADAATREGGADGSEVREGADIREGGAGGSTAREGGATGPDAPAPLLLPAGLNSAGEFCTIDGVCVPAPADGTADGSEGDGSEADAADSAAAAAGHPSSAAERDRG